jgi:hypothetical protein
MTFSPLELARATPVKPHEREEKNMLLETSPFVLNTVLPKWTFLIGCFILFTGALVLIVAMVEQSLNNLITKPRNNATLLVLLDDASEDDYR